MDGSAINAVKELAQQASGLQEIEGRKYSYGTLKLVERPLPTALRLQTLSGLVDYVEGNKDGLKPENLIIVAGNHKQVGLLGANEPDTQNRPNYASAELADVEVFPFDEFLDFETFMIKLLCLFQTGPELDAFIAKVFKVKVVDEEEHSDDGVSTTKTTKESVISEARREVVELKPFRTFQELDQPKSKFIFRISRTRGELSMALFECAGGAWVNDARQSIKAYFAKKLPDVTVLA